MPNEIEATVRLYVTSKVARSGQQQIAIGGLPVSPSKANPCRIRFTLRGKEQELVVRDTHAIWQSHQDAVTTQTWSDLFDALKKRAGLELPLKVHVVEDAVDADKFLKEIEEMGG